MSSLEGKTMSIVSLEEVIKQVFDADKTNSLEEYRKIVRYQSRHIFLEDVDENSAREIIRLIIEFNKEDLGKKPEERKPVKIFINSLGGSMTDAYAIMDSILMSETPVYTIGVGTCYSAGGLVLMAGHKRYMYPLASFMFHEGSAGIFGDAGKVKDTMKFYETQLKQMQTFILKKTKITPELYEQKLSNDWYLTSDECLTLGITDEIATNLL